MLDGTYCLRVDETVVGVRFGGFIRRALEGRSYPEATVSSKQRHQPGIGKEPKVKANEKRSYRIKEVVEGEKCGQVCVNRCFEYPSIWYTA